MPSIGGLGGILLFLASVFWAVPIVSASSEANLVLSPGSSFNHITSPHTVTAVVTDGSGNPLGGITVTFKWSFPGEENDELGDMVMTQVTNASGEACVTWTEWLPGPQLLRATVQDPQNASRTLSDLATVNWLSSVILSCDSFGVEKETFDLGETVYVCGPDFIPSHEYSVYVVESGCWWDGAGFPPRVPGTATIITSDSSGRILPTPIWVPPLMIGEFDIVVDVNDNGQYDETELFYVDAVDDMCGAGLLVVSEYWLGSMIALVGCFAAFGVFYLSKARMHRLD